MARAAETPLDEDLMARITSAQVPIDTDDDTALKDDDLDLLSDGERDAYEKARDEPDPEDAEAENTEARVADELAEQERLRAEARQAEAPDPVQIKSQAEQALSELADQREALMGELKTLRGKWEDGDLSDEELEAEEAKVYNARDDLTAKITLAKSAAQEAETQINSTVAEENAKWAAACDRFKAANEALWSPEHMDGFNRAVGDVTEDPAFASKSFDEQLAIAGRMYQAKAAALGQTVEVATAKAPASQKASKPARPKDPPPTLATIPAETVNPHQSNIAQVVAQLDRADALGREKIMAQLPDHIAEQVLNYAD